MIDYGKFQLSLKRLAEQYENHQHGSPERSDLDREGIAESVIQRFETCYDCLEGIEEVSDRGTRCRGSSQQPQAHLQTRP